MHLFITFTEVKCVLVGKTTVYIVRIPYLKPKPLIYGYYLQINKPNKNAYEKYEYFKFG